LHIFQLFQPEHRRTHQPAAVALNDVQLFHLFFQHHAGDLVAVFLQRLIQPADGVGNAEDLLPHGSDPVFRFMLLVGIAPEKIVCRLAVDLYQYCRLFAVLPRLLPDAVQTAALPEQKHAVLRCTVFMIAGQRAVLRFLPDCRGIVLPEQRAVRGIKKNGVFRLLTPFLDLL